MAKWEQLIAAREQMHLSQLEAAEYLNVGVVTYQRWEAGKARPQPQHMRQLCAIFTTLRANNEAPETSSTSTLPNITSSVSSRSLKGISSEKILIDEPQAFIATNMTAHLWSLAFLDQPASTDKRRSIRQAIKEFDSMNIDNKNYQITRREALRSLATLPLITLGLASPGRILPKAQYKSVLEQCTASVEACWEMRLSDSASDRLLVLQCATSYLSTLETIAHNSLEYRQEALTLATRYMIIKAFVARHSIGLMEAIQYGKEAVALSKETGDVSLQIISTQLLAGSYFCAKKYKLALLAAQEAESNLLQYTHSPTAQPFHPYVQGKTYSTLARMQAKNGLSPEVSLEKAIATDPDNESYDFIDFKYSTLLLEAGEAYCYYGDQTKAMDWLGKRVNPETLAPRFAQSKLARVETLNVMALSLLRTENRDMEKAIHVWVAGTEEAKLLKSEQRFNEALSNYELMEAVWPGERRIRELRDHLEHWEEE